MTEEYINKGLVEQLDAEIEYVDPTEGPFTLEDLEINKKDMEPIEDDISEEGFHDLSINKAEIGLVVVEEI